MRLSDAFPLRNLGAEEFRFGDELVEANAVISRAALSPRFDLAVLEVTGEDAANFLHGQLITDVKRLQRGHGALSGWCTPQGRVSFLFHLIATAQGYLLLAPTADAARLIQRLRLFVLRAKVNIVDISERVGVLGISLRGGAPVEENPWAAELATLSRYAATPLADGLGCLRYAEEPLFLVWGETGALVKFWEHGGLTTVGAAAWRLLEIHSGLPFGVVANEFLPQQLNLDRLDALSFVKGCYPGQEIIARLKYRGAVKSRALRITAQVPLTAGDKLLGADGARAVGTVLSAARGAVTEWIALAVLELAALTQPLTTGTGSPIEVTSQERQRFLDDA